MADRKYNTDLTHKELRIYTVPLQIISKLTSPSKMSKDRQFPEEENTKS